MHELKCSSSFKLLYRSRKLLAFISQATTNMPIFPSTKLNQPNPVAARYRSGLAKHPFLLFGLPFIATMVAGSFFLTPATALRYERHDNKVKQLRKDEEMELVTNQKKRKVDIREEYFRLAGSRDLDSWEQKRVKRLPGEPDGIL
jgi:cytochrome c oxidase assembly protein subunit 16